MHIRSLLAFGLLAVATPAFAIFNDAKGHTYEDSIQYVLDEGIVSGYPDRTYRPNQEINRAEFTKIIIEARFATEIESCNTATISFSDVDKSAWFAPYICVAAQKGIVAGYADGTFKPAKTVNAAEAAKIVATSYGIASEPGTAVWYQPYVDALKKNTAYPQTVSNVAVGLRRGEMAYMIHRLNAYADVPAVSGGCKVAGCSSQLCVEEDDEGVSTCEWREEYACYRSATCERQGDGKCGWTMTERLESCLDSDNGTIEESSMGTYRAWSPSFVDTQSEPYVLFFHAAWCPYCQKNDAFLQQFYGSGRADAYTVLKVDYDSEQSLRSSWGVTSQDTFILLEAGNDPVEIDRVTFPSQSALQELITK